jgi:replicative DNA helicase
MNDRMPPAALDAEEAVLGSILIDPACMVRVMKHVKPDDFFIVKNKMVFEAMLRLRSFAHPIDFVTIISALGDAGQLDDIGGAAYISRLVNSTPTAIHAEGYADMVRSASVSRGLIAAASSIAQIAYDGELTAEQKTAQALGELRSHHDTRGGEARSIGLIAADLVTQLEEWSEHPLGVDEVRGLSSGFPSIDKLTGGFGKQEQTVLAGRTGTGKSALAFQIAANVARAGGKVAIFSLEMAERMIGFRLISSEVEIPYQDMLRGWMKSDGWERMYQALARLEYLPIFVNDKSSQSIASIESVIASLEDVDLFIVDHLRLIKDIRKGENEVSRLGRLSMELRQIARDYNTHCLLITQLNRGLEARDDKRPTLADIRQSGEIEENADNVWGIYRAYDDKRILCVSPLKNRNGEAGIDIVSELEFDAQYMRFKRANRCELNGHA